MVSVPTPVNHLTMSQNPNPNQSSYGPEAGHSYAEKIDAFKKDLDAIEAGHPDLFANRGDKLADHYVLDATNTKTGFRFLPGSNLPESVKEECICAYRKEFALVE